MDAPETEGDAATERTEPAPEKTPLAFVDRDPTALDDATELYLLNRHAAGNGTVRVQLIDWERDGDAVLVAYALPTGERLRDRYRWPTAGRYGESDFLALVRGVGYPPGAADLITGEFARARSENGRWRIVTGRREDSDLGPGAERNADGGRTTERQSAADGRTAASDASAGLGRRVRRIDPMAAGTASVALFVLAVGVPASLAAVTGGLTAVSATIGGVLFVTAVTTLWLSVATVS